MTITPNTTPDNTTLLATLKIHKLSKRRSAPGTWVHGTMGGHRFEALVFPEPAASPDYEIPGSNISKFWMDNAVGIVVANFDRCRSITPVTRMAKRITDVLAAGLAELVYRT